METANLTGASYFMLFSKLSGGFVLLMGLLVLVGWAFDIPLLKSLHPSFVTMKPNTAVGFVLAGTSLLLPSVAGRRTLLRWIEGALPCLILLLGVLTLAQYIFGWSFGIDELLLQEDLNPISTSHPGRMAPTTALSFLLVGIGLLANKFSKIQKLREPALIAASLIAIIAIVGYVYDIGSLRSYQSYTHMALHTATLFLVLSIGVITALPDRGFISLLVGSGASAQAGRRLLPSVIIVPIFFGWLRLQGQRAGFYDTEFGLALMVVTIIVSLCVAVLWNLGVMEAADQVKRKAEEQVRRERDATEMVNKELEAFSYSVSHDLRAPLRGIDGFSQALLEDHAEKLDEEGKAHLTRVRSAAQKMGELIDDLIQLSRVTRNELKRGTVDLSSIAHEVIEALRHTHPERRVDIVVEDGIVVEGDAHLLRIAVDNLLNNAWKFTSRQLNARIEFGATRGADGRRTYFVRDNGAGFDMTYANKLFGAFQRLHSTMEFPGTGIGLATVQRIFLRHGGKIWAEGKVSDGATFFFML